MSLNVFAANEDSIEISTESHKVYVEPSYVETTRTENRFELKPYLERRGKWGSTLSLAYSAYVPENLESSFVAAGILQPYSKPTLPLVEAQYVFKRNTPIGSLGGELGLGYFSNSSSDTSISDSSLQFKMVRLGVVAAIDTLYKEPFLVPYGSAGIYTIYFREEQNGISFNGNTQVAPYLSAGAMFLLDWLDRDAARISYEDTGTQCSYLFGEVRSMMKSAAEQDPDYSSAWHWNAGLRVEF